jgi:hypothetical protein
MKTFFLYLICILVQYLSTLNPNRAKINYISENTTQNT